MRAITDRVRDLNRVYRAEPALWEADVDSAGFQWIDCNDADGNIVSFLRIAPSGRRLVCVVNGSGVTRRDYRIGLPAPGRYRELINTDAREYGGHGAGNLGGVEAEAVPCHGLPYSAALTLPALGVVWFEVPRAG